MKKKFKTVSYNFFKFKNNQLHNSIIFNYVAVSRKKIMFSQIKLAKYFVYIEVYDFSVGEEEVVETSKVTIKQITQLGLQVRFVDAESGEVITGSGQGRAITTKTATTLGDIEGPAFNKSTVGVSTKKALETSSVRVVEKLIKKGVFKN